MNATLLKHSGYNTFCFTGRAVLDATARLHLTGVFEKHPFHAGSSYLLDLSGVERVNSSGIALLIELKKISLAKGVHLSFINASQSLKNKLHLYRVDRILFHQ